MTTLEKSTISANDDSAVKSGPVWPLLSDESTDVGRAFMREYRELDDKLGNSLGQLAEQPQDIQGRDREIALLHAILERPRTPVALLLGQAGVGKTALVEQFSKELNSGNYSTNVHNRYFMVSLRLGVLASLGKNELQSRLATILDDLKSLEILAQELLDDESVKIVLFADEVHMLVTIFGPGTKVGGDVMKDILARAPIRCVFATTRREYDATLAVDKPLSERFKQIEMQELPQPIIVDIIKNWWEKVAPDCPMPSTELIEKVIDANAMYRSDSAEPRKSLDIMEDLVSYSRRTGNAASEQEVNDIFKRRYSISLSFQVDADAVYAEVDRRIKGQPYVKHQLRRALRSMVFQLEPTSNKPYMTLLFTGPTGVGKALTNDTRIPTPTGFTRMGDIAVGDTVFSEAGTSTRVTNVFPQGEKQVFDVCIGEHGSTVVQTHDEHLWGVATRDSLDKPLSVMTTREMREALEKGVELFVPLTEPVERDEIVSPIHAENLVATWDKGNFIIEHSDALRVPRSIVFGSIRQRKEFLRAYSASHLVVSTRTANNETSGIVSLHAPHEEFAHDLIEIISSLGAHAYIEEFDDVQSLHVSMSLAHALFLDMIQDEQMHDVVEGLANASGEKPSDPIHRFVPVARIDATDSFERMTCITVDSESHLYLAGEEYTVTHNTETAKAIAHALYPGEDALFYVNMPDYDSAAKKDAFRKHVGERIRHAPNSILLLDEIDKAANEVRDDFLSMTDEGLASFPVTNREGLVEVNTVSLRNTILICTTNAGASIFANDAEFSQRNIVGDDATSAASNAEVDALMSSLRTNLIEQHGFRPEFINRFDRILAFRSLTQQAFVDIAQTKLDDMLAKFETRHDIKAIIEQPHKWEGAFSNFTASDVALFITQVKLNAAKSNAGGARRINNTIDSEVKDSLIDCILDHPECKQFKIEVSKDAKIYKANAVPSEGGIIVSPVQ